MQTNLHNITDEEIQWKSERFDMCEAEGYRKILLKQRWIANEVVLYLLLLILP